MIAIIDYDIGNLAAVANMLKRLGMPCEITSDPDTVEVADRIILPGNGAFDACMKNLKSTGLIPLLERQVLQKQVPLLGICVGAQMLGHGSDEGLEAGLGWIDMVVKRFPDMPGLPVPNMGWNDVALKKDGNGMARCLEPDSRFYFVHSYYMQPANQADVLLESTYGIVYAAAVSCGNICGVQFHPEKSHRFGKKLFQAFSGRE